MDDYFTYDKFMIVIETKEENRGNVESMLRSSGAIEVHNKG